MKFALIRQETGAVLVQTALMLTVLLLFVGLAVDVGNLYAERRHMQNAADAGALAGARALCFGGDPVSMATVYAKSNGADEDKLLVDVQGSQVRVVAIREVTTYFAGLRAVNVRAEATALCNMTTRLCGTFPVVFDKATWDKIPCGGSFYVWDDGSITEDMCEECACEGIMGSSAHIGAGNLGWVRFTAPPAPYENPGRCGGNCGNAALECWIQNGYSGPLEVGDCVHGKPGVDSAALRATKKRLGDSVFVLLWAPGPCNRVVGSCPGSDYHIVDFGYIRLDAVEEKLTIPARPGHEGAKCPKNAKAIRATKLCNPPAIGCGATEGGSSSSRPDAVSLID